VRATVIGAGLAGCEAAWQLARAGVETELVDMKPGRKSPAHTLDTPAELVCSNSLRSDRLENAVGLLKEEMRRLDSLIMAAAEENRVPAGGALAVDRVGFSHSVEARLRGCPLIRIVSREAGAIPEGPCVVATGR
jgi:methylenetetrahydrofolate--tRNA-(uracil-5-)-methyltransferase